MTLSCGLDFGTSNSTLGRIGADDQPHLVPLENGSATIPSVLFFSFEDNQIHFGRDAVAEYVTGAEGRLMRSIKSVLGTSLFNDTTRIKAKRYGYGDIIGTYVAELKKRAEAHLGDELTQVVLGRPVQFVDDDPAADRQAQDQLEAAVRAQGFKDIAFQFEPIAAALDYERHVNGERLALIIDLGGGTSDFSLVKVAPGNADKADRSDDILGTGGVHIGGTDFDRLLAMSRVMPELGLGSMTKDGKRHLPVAPYYDLSTWHRINRLYDAQAIRDLRSTMREAVEAERVETMITLVEERLGHRLIGAVEGSKIELSDKPVSAFDFDVNGSRIRTDISVEQLAEALDDSIGKLETTIGATLAQAGVKASDIDSLILTGGSTLVPAVANRLQARFPEAEVIRTDVLGSVGLGLSLEAKRIFGA
ncbi:Hsp70 family protein [Devosia sp. MC521]|uniref:Hsp70 family protein n=1 Tax=Devosia sp. MC521 TaxID=2759954 RepID=UPI0015FBEE2F|nr:Hsp70 family protein [Devosia sp. MC521]MBJ6987306.1 Hsp70 family protein [Devosia sp. MC521]QMW63484.1 Hsp70 family protein [Devosia sp. MC521]